MTDPKKSHKNFKEIRFALCFLFFGILNSIWSHYSDYQLNYWIAEHYYKINLTDYWHDFEQKENNLWLLNSLYIGRNYLAIPIFITVFFLSGFATSLLLFNLVEKKKNKLMLIIAVIMLWILKIPVPYYYSSIPGIEAGLFAL